MQMIKLEIQNSYKRALAEFGISALVVILTLSFYINYKEVLLDLSHRINELPSAFLNLLGAGPEFSFIKIPYFFGYVMAAGNIVLAYFKFTEGVNALSREEQTGSISYLLALPVSRIQILLYKYLVHVLYYAVYMILLFGVAAVLIAPQALAKIVMINWLQFTGNIMMGSFLIGVLFLSLGFLMAAVLRREKQLGDYPFFVTLTLLFTSALPGIVQFAGELVLILKGQSIGFISDLSYKLVFLKELSPFEWVNPMKSVSNEFVSREYYGIAIGVMVLFIGLAAFFYQKKDFN